MALDKNKVKKNAEQIVSAMSQGYRYSLSKLQELTKFNTTDLCLAMLVLIQDHRVQQLQCGNAVCYVRNCC